MSEPGELQLDALQGRLCYQFSDLTILKRALTHRSAGRDHNERLEFLGDAVIGLAAAAAFYDRFPEADEGVLSRLRSLVVSGHSLAAIAKELDLSSCLILGESERKSGGRHRDSILADTLEALIGAVALDAGSETALQVAGEWLRSAVESASGGKVGRGRHAETSIGPGKWLNSAVGWWPSSGARMSASPRC